MLFLNADQRLQNLSIFQSINPAENFCPFLDAAPMKPRFLYATFEFFERRVFDAVHFGEIGVQSVRKAAQ